MKIVYAWAPPAGWAAIIFLISSTPGVPGPAYLSYIAHFVEYAILAALVYRAVGHADGVARAVAGAVAASLYGATDELHQLFVPGRQADFIDWLVDSLGVIVAVGLIAIWRRGKKKAARAGGADR